MKKTFPIDAVLSLTTGILVGPFDKLHELIEHVAGHPVWTHELAERALWGRLSELVFSQHPQLRDAKPFSCAAGLPKATIDTLVASYVEEASALFGAEVEIDAGDLERTEGPLVSAQRILKEAGRADMPIVAVVVK